MPPSTLVTMSASGAKAFEFERNDGLLTGQRLAHQRIVDKNLFGPSNILLLCKGVVCGNHKDMITIMNTQILQHLDKWLNFPLIL